jgi:hypothetical protein
MDFKNKYMKYKSKYLKLKEQFGSGDKVTILNFELNISNEFNLEWINLININNFNKEIKIPNFIKNLDKIVFSSGDGYHGPDSINDPKFPNVRQYWEKGREYNIHCCKEGYSNQQLLTNLEWINNNNKHKDIIICFIDFYNYDQCEIFSNIFQNQIFDIITDENSIFMNIKYVKKILKTNGKVTIGNKYDFLIDTDKNKIQKWYILGMDKINSFHKRKIDYIIQFRNCIEKIIQNKNIMGKNALSWGYFEWTKDNQLIIIANLNKLEKIDEILFEAYNNKSNEFKEFCLNNLKEEIFIKSFSKFNFNFKLYFFTLIPVEPNDFIKISDTEYIKT